MAAPLDSKFHGVLFKNKDNAKLDPGEFIVFLAKDNALLPTLQFYFDELKRIGADEYQLAGVTRLMQKVDAWRQANPEKCKVPDLDPATEVMS